MYGGLDVVKMVGGDSSDTIYGGAADETLTGGASDDIVYGNHGNDTVNGGMGNDILIGGEGADWFVFDNDGVDEFDVITDYTIGEDLIDLTAFRPNTLRSYDFVFSSAGDGMIIVISSDNYSLPNYTIQLQGVDDYGSLDILY